MKNNDILIDKINKGIKYLTSLDSKLTPVIDYLTEKCIEQKEQLPPDKAFEYLIQFLNVKTESLVLYTKMKEILEYQDDM